MAEYVVKRLLWFIPVILITLTVLFLLLQILPGDPIRAAFGQEVPLSPERVAVLRAELGLDQPVYARYFKWLWDVAHLNLGTSFFTGSTVSEQLATRLPVTVTLLAISMFLVIALSLPCGVLSGYYRGRWPDLVVRSICILLISLPHFWVAVVAILLLLKMWGWFVPIQYATIFTDPSTALQQLVIPALIMALRPFGIATRMIRSSMIEVLEENYIRTARAKGVTELRLTRLHALPNSMLPVVTYYGLEVIVLLGGTVVMEQIFAVPGIGSMIAQAAYNHDLYVLQGAVLVLLFVALFVNLGLDILYAKLDPRIRFEE